MNTGRGDSCYGVRMTRLGLWLLALVLPVDGVAQQPPPGAPGFNPWSLTAPYNQFQPPAGQFQPPSNQYPPPAGQIQPPGNQFQPPAGQFQPPGNQFQPPASRFQPPGNQFQPPANPFQPPAVAPVPGNLNRPQTAPQQFGGPPRWNYPSMPGVPGYAEQPPSQAAFNRPYVEVTVDSSEAYVHQNLVLTLQVVSPVNLRTVSAELPDSDDVIFRQLGEITASTRTRFGQREIVNTLYYQLTPLRSGTIAVESIPVSGTMDNGSPAGVRYQAMASQPIRLTVEDPVAGVHPWLPLHELELSASLSNDEYVGAGDPLTLTVKQQAVGMSGTQLPSLEAQLQAPGHRLYREKSEFEGTVSKQGRLIGTRTDRFTLVPQQGDRVEIPAIRVNWWNVERQRKETAVLPGRLLNEGSGSPGEHGGAAIRLLADAMGSVPLWLTLLAVAFLLGRYWSWLAPRLRHVGNRVWQQLDINTRPLRGHLTMVLGRLSPQRNLPLIRRKVADSLPRSARLWFCVRGADEEQDADDWSQVLRFLISRRLGLSAQLPMSKLADVIIEIHPGADADKIRSLLRELEAALFAGRRIRDFDAWKQEFKHQIRPRPLARLTQIRRSLRPSGLPSLNPTVS